MIGLVFGLVGGAIGLAAGLVALVFGLTMAALPLAVLAGVAAFVAYMFRKGYQSTKRDHSPAKPMESVETEVVDDFQSFYHQNGR